MFVWLVCERVAWSYFFFVWYSIIFMNLQQMPWLLANRFEASQKKRASCCPFRVSVACAVTSDGPTYLYNSLFPTTPMHTLDTNSNGHRCILYVTDAKIYYVNFCTDLINIVFYDYARETVSQRSRKPSATGMLLHFKMNMIWSKAISNRSYKRLKLYKASFS